MLVILSSPLPQEAVVSQMHQLQIVLPCDALKIFKKESGEHTHEFAIGLALCLQKVDGKNLSMDSEHSRE